jgi:hypothetical protein
VGYSPSFFDGINTPTLAAMLAFAVIVILAVVFSVANYLSRHQDDALKTPALLSPEEAELARWYWGRAQQHGEMVDYYIKCNRDPARTDLTWMLEHCYSEAAEAAHYARAWLLLVGEDRKDQFSFPGYPWGKPLSTVQARDLLAAPPSPRGDMIGDDDIPF